MDCLFITVDARYAGVLHVFLRCLQRHYPAHPEIVVCTSDWSKETFTTFDRQFPGLRWLDAQALRFPSGPPMLHDPSFDRPVMYARWAAFTEPFERYDTVLYLDVDMLVLGPLDDLLACDGLLTFEDAYPHSETLVFRDPVNPDLLALLREDGLSDWVWHAANAGVIVMPRSYRTVPQLEEIQRLADRYWPHLMWGDQSVLNLWLARNGLSPARDFRFNYQVRLLLERREVDNYRHARVLHFNGMHSDVEWLMALSDSAMRFVPGGRRLVPQLTRAAVWRGWPRVPAYRLRRWLKQQLIAQPPGPAPK